MVPKYLQETIIFLYAARVRTAVHGVDGLLVQALFIIEFLRRVVKSFTDSPHQTFVLCDVPDNEVILTAFLLGSLPLSSDVRLILIC